MAGLGAVLLMATVTASAQPPSAAAALTGVWGGQRLQLVLDVDGGRLEGDCASGTFSGPLRPGADGRFLAHGHFEDHAPGPQAGDALVSVQSATLAEQTRFSGSVDGKRMWLEILPPGSSTPQRFELLQGVTVKRVRCL